MSAPTSDNSRQTDRTSVPSGFSALAERKQRGAIGEMFAMLRENKKWWLVPIVIGLLLLGALSLLGSTGAAPFIYTLF